ncbi:MAG: SusC/RagA family TonB-linked outer membrane protein [bacterium]
MGCRRIILVLASFVAAAAHAQTTGRVTGTVLVEGRGIANATIVVLGTNPVIGTTSDAAGRYTLNAVPAGSQRVQARRLGFAALTVPVVVTSGQTATADFALVAQAVQLERVVAVGYGTQSRREVAGAIASLSSEDFHQVVGANPLDALKGRIPGVDITSGSFEPGAADNIRIRGIRSIMSNVTTPGAMNANNGPLYVVDGVPITGDLRDIDQTSIDRIEVLKDASAAAVFGSRGANGVIMITTKRGTTTGKTEFTASSTYGASKITREVPMMSGQEFANFRRESYRAGGTAAQQAACTNYMTDPTACDQFALDPTMRTNLAAGVNTDWQSLMLRNGSLQNTQAAFAGGNENTRFRAGFGYLGQQGISFVQDYVARSTSFNLSHDYKRLNLQLGVQAVRNFRNAGRGATMWDETLFNPALGRMFDSSGAPVFLPTEDGLLVNPVMAASAYIRQIDRTNVLGTLTGSYEIADGLRAHVNFGPQYTSQSDGNFIGTFTKELRGVTAPYANLTNTTNTNFTLSNFLDLDRTYRDKHHVQATVLYEVASFRTVLDTAAAKGLPFDSQLWYNLGNGATPTVFGAFTRSALQSYMGRLNYTFLDRYTLSLTGRYDGSSVLAEGHKYAFFPAAAIAWQVGDEAFMRRLPAVSDLKLRLSYGSVGNSAISAYQTLGLLGRTQYYNANQAILGYQPGSIPNPSLKWERTDKFDAGVDFGIFGQRITGSVDIYRENTHDLLLNRTLPYTSGYASILQNVGATRNDGIELGLSTQNLNKWHGVDWTSDVSYSTNKNQIVSLLSGQTKDIGSGWWVGMPINVYYDYQYAGIWQTADSALASTMCNCKPGTIRVQDVNGDGKITVDDRTFIGRHINFPRWQGSLNNRVAFRNVDVSMLATARIGYTINDAFTSAYNSLAGRFNNIETNYWTPENQSGTEPRPSVQGLGQYASARNYKDGSFVRIRDITLGYTLPSNLTTRFSAGRARLYVRAQDPFISTSYQGWDPEGGNNAGNGANNASQIDVGGPAFRTFLAGLDIRF